jgi:hypothetical protein
MAAPMGIGNKACATIHGTPQRQRDFLPAPAGDADPTRARVVLVWVLVAVSRTPAPAKGAFGTWPMLRKASCGR